MHDQTGPRQGSRPSLSSASDDRLAELIDQGKTRIVFVAPGLSGAVADALSCALVRLGPNSVTIILDADPEVCRLGYGTLDGLERVREAAAANGTLVCHQPGLRIGLLIVDDRTLVFSPTPLLIEAGSRTPERPNAIELGAPPPGVIQDLGLGAGGATDRRIGQDPIESEQMAAVRRDLEATPPVQFDLARQVRVFSAHFQFVELKMTGCHLSRRRISIPPRLIGLARSREVQRRFQATFDLIDTELEVREGTRRITEESLSGRKLDIAQEYLVALPGYGSVVLRSKKERLIEAVEELRSDVQRFSQGVKSQLEPIVQQGRNAVRDLLLPALMKNPPDSCTEIYGPQPSAADVRAWLEDELERCFASSTDLVGDMKVTLIFKDVAYESLVDARFLGLARSAMPRLDTLHLEFDAAPGKPSTRCA